ncbi:MAG: hypothetical protein ACT4TC_22950 [Myxococcaceae bacterium]
MRELKARYRASFLGFLWTFLNPTLHMLVYALMFDVLLRQGMPRYPYFIFVGRFCAATLAHTSCVSGAEGFPSITPLPPPLEPSVEVPSGPVIEAAPEQPARRKRTRAVGSVAFMDR